MKETRFIRQNKEKWRKLEHLLDQKKKNPDELSELFIEVTDDLSYSRSFYPNRSVRVYLNTVAQRIFHSIYKTTRFRQSKFLFFWKEDLPHLVYHSRYEFLLSLCVFVLAALIGVLSTIYDPEFPRVILGDAYVDMTIANIESGDPMKVYKESKEVDMFLGITLNNIQVAFLTTLSGLLFGLGTIFILLQNGIMLGSFQYFFIEKGIFWDSFLTIWLHGTVEIASIIIAGAAGLILGRGLVFPGSYSRLQSFIICARKAIKILVALVPLFIFAGFVEGFITRYTEAPYVIRGLLILASLVYIIGYFVVYPWLKSRQGFKTNIEDERPSPDGANEIDFTTVKSNGEIFRESFLMVKKYLGKLFLISLLGGTFFTVFAQLLIEPRFNMNFYMVPVSPFQMFFYIGTRTFTYLSDVLSFFNYTQYPAMFVVNSVVLAAAIFSSGYFLQNDSTDKSPEATPHPVKFVMAKGGWVVAAILLYQAVLFIPGWPVKLIAALALPLFLMLTYSFMNAERGSTAGFHELRHISRIGRIYALFLILSIVSLVFMFIIFSPVLYLYVDLIQTNFNTSPEVTDRIFHILLTFITGFYISLVVMFLMLGFGLQFHTLKEIKEATFLKEKIKRLGKQSTIHGLAKE